jgi:hypothetical protein
MKRIIVDYAKLTGDILNLTCRENFLKDMTILILFVLEMHKTN